MKPAYRSGTQSAQNHRLRSVPDKPRCNIFA
jgi:hypothetical protein